MTPSPAATPSPTYGDPNPQVSDLPTISQHHRPRRNMSPTKCSSSSPASGATAPSENVVSVIEPATGEVITTGYCASEKDVDEASRGSESSLSHVVTHHSCRALRVRRPAGRSF